MIIGRTELRDYIAKTTDLSKADSSIALEQALSAISFYLSKGEEIRLIGFGSFQTGKSKAREGYNPKTGEKMQIPEKTRVVFRAGKNLKKVVNS